MFNSNSDNFTDYKEEVLVICQRAETDVQMEFSLQNCEEVWLSKVFELKTITRKRINVSNKSLKLDFETIIDIFKSL